MAKQEALIDAPTQAVERMEGHAEMVRVEDDPNVSMFERLARDPNVDVTKIERLIAMQERVMANKAKAAFDDAFASMQGEMPVVIERGKTNNGQYARLEDIQKTVRPVLQKFGFAISYETHWPDAKTVEVIGILTHKDGHERRSSFMSAADSSGSKNAIQGLGSAVSYGRRYTALDLLNITTSDRDDDGAATSRLPQAPSGYDAWLTDFEATADEGIAKLTIAWNKSKPEFRDYLVKYEPAKKQAIQDKARKVKA